MAFGISTMNALLSLTDQINMLNQKTEEFIDNGGLVGKIGRSMRAAQQKRQQHLEETDPEYFKKITRGMSLAAIQKKSEEIKQRQLDRARQQKESEIEKRYKEHLKKLNTTKFKNRETQDKAYKELIRSYEAELKVIRDIDREEQNRVQKEYSELAKAARDKMAKKYGHQSQEDYDDFYDDDIMFSEGSVGGRRTGRAVGMFQNSKDPDEYLLGEKMEQEQKEATKKMDSYQSEVTSNLNEQTLYLKEIKTFLKEDLESIMTSLTISGGSEADDGGLINKFKKGGIKKLVGKAGGLLKGAAGIASKAALPLLAAKGLYDGITSGMDDDAIFEQAGYQSADEITFGDRLKHGGAGAVAGLVNWIPGLDGVNSSSVVNTGESIMNWLGGKGFNSNRELRESGMSEEEIDSGPSLGMFSPLAVGAKVAGMAMSGIKSLVGSGEESGEINTGDSPIRYNNVSDENELTGIRGELAKLYDEQDEIRDSVKTLSLEKSGAGSMPPVIINNNNSQTTMIPSPPRFRIQDNSTAQLSVQGV